jgi:maltose O-acetyltransferase
MNLIKKSIFYFILFIINNFLCGTRNFAFKRWLLNQIGISVGSNTKIVGPIKLNYINKVTIGKDCWIGRNFIVDGNGSVTIGDRCDFAPSVVINTGGHEIGTAERRAGKGITHISLIGSGTWIGTKVLIINGSKIGDSVIVAAGSVVTKEVDSNLLVAGVPAMVKRKL